MNWKKAVEDVMAMVVLAAIFSALFILGHLALRQEMPRLW